MEIYTELLINSIGCDFILELDQINTCWVMLILERDVTLIVVGEGWKKERSWIQISHGFK